MLKSLAIGIALLALIGFVLPPTPIEDSFVTLMGEPINLRQWRGKPVVITFWATDCPACIQEIPELIALYQRFHARGLEILAINMAYDPPSHVVAMVAARQLPYPVALDVNGEHARAFGDVKLTPSSFLLTPDGVIALRYTGAFDSVELSAQIERLLKG